MCTPISASSKVVQLLAILRAKNAESVSPLTWFISAFTNLSKFSVLCIYKMISGNGNNYIKQLCFSKGIHNMDGLCRYITAGEFYYLSSAEFQYHVLRSLLQKPPVKAGLNK